MNDKPLCTLVFLLSLLLIDCATAADVERERAALAPSVSTSIGTSYTNGAKPWTVQTSVTARYFSEVGQALQFAVSFTPLSVQPVLPSPDGSRFAVLLRSADLAADQNIAELRVYDTAAVRKGLTRAGQIPTPMRVLTRRSASNAPALVHPRWSEDGQSMMFMTVVDQNRRTTPWRGDLGLADTSLVKLSRMDIATGSLTDLVPAGEFFDVRNEDVVLDWRGENVIYWTRPITGVEDLRLPDRYPVSVVDVENLRKMGDPRRAAVWADSAIFLATHGTVRKLEGVAYTNSARAAISPRGNLAIIVALPLELPPWPGCPKGGPALTRCHQFMALDLSSGELRGLIDAPAATHSPMGNDVAPQILWTPDGSRALLVNTTLPSDPAHPEWTNASFVASVDPQTRSFEPITPMEIDGLKVDRVAWAVPGEVLRVSTSSTTCYFRRSGDRWVRSTRAPLATKSALTWTLPAYDRSPILEDEAAAGVSNPIRVSNGLSLELREGPNQPQVLVASADGHERELIGIDPSLKGVTIAPSRVVRWRTDDGHEERGLLTMPIGARKGVPSPLVIQNYYFMPHLFRPDGPFTSAYAAQALAARGFAVLGIDLSFYEQHRGAKGSEGTRGVMTIDSAVEMLAGQNLVDPKRVGIVGFSRGGFVPFYAITHPGRITLAAALSSDSALFTYLQYLREAAQSYPTYIQQPGQYSTEWTISGKEQDGGFWQNKETWLRENPEFNIDRVSTPYLFAGNGIDLNYYEQFSDLMALFAINHRPLELLNLPLGEHPLVRPLEREASLTATVDWMDFWLNGREDSQAGGSEKYARWRQLRADWEAQKTWEAAGNPAGSAPPKTSARMGGKH